MATGESCIAAQQRRRRGREGKIGKWKRSEGNINRNRIENGCSALETGTMHESDGEQKYQMKDYGANTEMVKAN